ncbi:alpha-E domain-containing protein [Pseudohalioglobus sediminis]|uniref:Alpha-E domain-containing protein n=1 Tax=Pseudohalioglobus sediminis TaxID=2606449 RepID=A0A5B0WP54_9GAMM|nr:alpha-E domain-containing protein [Pseudohalioglobus sediminis]KAA1188854.1 alpha-E domain-containing protein [Pseudohalioglobus sediminis]
MRLLSRVAERLYWMARYLERAEDTARLLRSYTHLIMDIPAGSEPGWDVLLQTLDAQHSFGEHYRVANETNVLKFLIADHSNASSIAQSIRAARENVRTTRDVLPSEVWEHVNELYLYTEKHAANSVGRRNRHDFFDQLIGRCQMINGLMTSTLCRDHAYRFVKIGHLLERADMTTRVLDAGIGALMNEERNPSTTDPLVWASVLSSLSAMETYRRTVGPMVEGAEAVDFIFRDPTLPRSLRFCLGGIREELVPMRNNRNALRVINRSRRSLSRFDPQAAGRRDMHRFIDRFQANLLALGEEINVAWFLTDQA